MRLLLPQEILERLQRELRRGGRREIGGLLMGEHVTDNVFRVVDLTVQRSGGTVSCFVRDPADHQSQLDAFFERHGQEFRRFNYLGEWHSHPLFKPQPSETDVTTMRSIVNDAAVGANFLVLMIVRIGWRGQLQLSASAFVAYGGPIGVDVGVEWTTGKPERVPVLRRIQRLFTDSRWRFTGRRG